MVMTKKTTKKVAKKSTRKPATKPSARKAVTPKKKVVAKKTVAKAKGAVDKPKQQRGAKLKGAARKTAAPKSGLQDIRDLMEEAAKKARDGKKKEAIKLYHTVANQREQFPRKAWRARIALKKLGVKIDVDSPMKVSSRKPSSSGGGARKPVAAAKVAASRERAREEKEEIAATMNDHQRKVVTVLKKAGDKVQWCPVQEVFKVTKRNADTQKFRQDVMDRLSKAKLVGRIVEGRSHAGGLNELIVRVVEDKPVVTPVAETAVAQ
jgi:hypothetical protein